MRRGGLEIMDDTEYLVHNKNYMRPGMITVNPYGVLVVGVIFLPTVSSHGTINPISIPQENRLPAFAYISTCEYIPNYSIFLSCFGINEIFQLSIKKSRRDALLVKKPTPPPKISSVGAYCPMRLNRR
jgi:hypothetical protein